MKHTEKNDRSKLPIRKAAAASQATAPYPAFGQLSPFGAMRRFAEEFENMFDDFNRVRRTPVSLFDLELPEFNVTAGALWAPQVEVAENNGELTVRADLPGLKKEDINVEFKENSVMISGERREESKEEREGYFHSELTYGSFYRRIPLPEGADLDKATAIFKDGVLEIRVATPKAVTGGRKLEITEAKPEPGAAKKAV
jgi:HSP20 family protein